MPKLQLNRRAALLRGLLASAAVSAVAMIATSAHAQALDERVWIELSGYAPSLDTTVVLSRTGQPGTTINVEEDLGLDDSQILPAVYAGWRFGERWVLTGEFYGLDRDGKKTISRDITFDGSTYPVGVSITSAFRSDVYRATIGYSFIKNDTAEIGASLGLHATDFEVALAGEAFVGATTTRQVTTRRRDFVAPMPTIGLYGTAEFSDRWVANGRVDFMSLDSGDYGGGITNAQASIAYRFTPMFSMGASYRFVSYDLEIQKDYSGDFDYDFSGPALFVRFGFQ